MDLDKIEHKARTSSIGVGTVLELIDLIRKQEAALASQPAQPAVTVDTPEFRKLLATLVEAGDYGPDEYGEARAPFIAHIDAHTAAAVAAAYKDGWANGWDQAHNQSAAPQPPKLNDIEQYRMQMAGISTAALGYWKEGDSIAPEYDTQALRDVARLHTKYAELKAAPQPAQAALSDEQIQAVDQAAQLLDESEQFAHANVLRAVLAASQHSQR